MTRRQNIITAVLVFLVLFVGAAILRTLSAKKKSTISEFTQEEVIREVAVGRFTPSDMARTISIDGRLNAYEKINIGAEVTGKLLSSGKTYKPGSAFRKGNALFQIDSKDELYSLYAQRSSLLNAITVIMPDIKLDFPSAYTLWETYLNDFSIKNTTAEIPEASSQQEKYFLASKNVLNLYYNIKSLEDRISNYTITAPFSGTFISVNAYPGALVSPGMNLGQVMNTSQFELIAPIAMADLQYISQGQSVALYAEELDASWKGKINRISNQIDQSTQSIPLYISVSGSGLKDGVFVKGEVKGNTIKDVVRVPRASLNEENIWLYDNGKALSKEIEIISREGDSVVVKGVLDSDDIIISSTNNLYEGQTLSIAK
ncbi:MAG: membrane fusion protein (multidrug efflux system) [Limisphaerales bacterium]|jgi:membrane fusion protein (multidrug efflux system)